MGKSMTNKARIERFTAGQALRQILNAQNEDKTSTCLLMDMSQHQTVTVISLTCQINLYKV